MYSLLFCYFLFFLGLYFILRFQKIYPFSLIGSFIDIFCLIVLFFIDVETEMTFLIEFFRGNPKYYSETTVAFFLFFIFLYCMPFYYMESKKRSKGEKSLRREVGRDLRRLGTYIAFGHDGKIIEHAHQTFKISDLIEVKLIGNETVIFIDGHRFNHCKYLLLNLDKNKEYKEIRSIDEASEKLQINIEELKSSIDEASEELNGEMEGNHIIVSPEVEFWGHCSNLQAWYEHGYDTRLLRQNLAFPLLERLADAGDEYAKVRLKEEILLRFEEGYDNTIIFLLESHYLKHFKKEELLEAIEGMSNKEIAYGLKFYINYVKKSYFDGEREMEFNFRREQNIREMETRVLDEIIRRREEELEGRMRFYLGRGMTLPDTLEHNHDENEKNKEKEALKEDGRTI